MFARTQGGGGKKRIRSSPMKKETSLRTVRLGRVGFAKGKKGGKKKCVRRKTSHSRRMEKEIHAVSREGKGKGSVIAARKGGNGIFRRASLKKALPRVPGEGERRQKPREDRERAAGAGFHAFSQRNPLKFNVPDPGREERGGEGILKRNRPRMQKSQEPNSSRKVGPTNLLGT